MTQKKPVIPSDVILEKVEYVIPEKAPLVWNTPPDVVERLTETGVVAYDEQGRPHARLPRTSDNMCCNGTTVGRASMIGIGGWGATPEGPGGGLIRYPFSLSDARDILGFYKGR